MCKLIVSAGRFGNDENFYGAAEKRGGRIRKRPSPHRRAGRSKNDRMSARGPKAGSAPERKRRLFAGFDGLEGVERGHAARSHGEGRGRTFAAEVIGRVIETADVLADDVEVADHVALRVLRFEVGRDGDAAQGEEESADRLEGVVRALFEVELHEVFLLAAEFGVDARFGVGVHLLHRFAQVLRGYADLERKLFDRVGLEGPTALLTDFPGLRERLERGVGEDDGVEGKYRTLLDHAVHLFLVEDRVGNAARRGHGVVDVDEDGAAGFVEEAAAGVVHPEPGLGEGAAALLEFVRTRELIDRGNVRKVRSVAGHGVHAGYVGADETGHVDAVARAAVDHRAAQPNRFDHAEGGGVEDVLCEHFFVGGEAARGDDHLAGAHDDLVTPFR